MRKKYYRPVGERLPRWVLIPVGIVFLPITLLSSIVSLFMIFSPNEFGNVSNVPITVLKVVIGIFFLIGSLWGTYLLLRMIFVNPNKANFTSPFGLRVFAFFSYFSYIFSSSGSFSSSYSARTLWALAKQREKTKINLNKRR